MKFTLEAWNLECASVAASKDNIFVTAAEHAARVQELTGGPKWAALGDDIAAKVENDYQRFLASHGRVS